jgi:hypothetical protein
MIRSSKEVKNAPADELCRNCCPEWGDQPPTGLQEIGERASDDCLLRAVGTLRAAEVALQDLVFYLDSDRLLARLALTKNLKALLSALHDIRRGKKPSRIFKAARGGVPTQLSKAALRGQSILMLEMLENILGRTEASKWLASRLKEAGVKEDGKAITPSMIQRWRSEKGGKSLSGSDQAYDILRDRLEQVGWPANAKEAKIRVDAHIWALVAAGYANDFLNLMPSNSEE